MRTLLTLALLLSIGCFVLPNAQPVWSQGEVSILRPATRVQAEYQFRLSGVNPETRGENQLVLYTPAYGASTRTAAPGFEATVVEQVVMAVGESDSSIPANGFVVSAHGTAAQWLSRFAKPGARLWYSQEAGQVTIQHTPQVYLNEVDSALQRAQSRQPANAERFSKFLTEAQTCRERLVAQAASGVLTPELVEAAGTCVQSANRAFYNTIPSVPGEFRGAWLRPEGGVNAERVRQKIETLKSLGIQNVFLETYYQGRTAYPSDVMAAYGLPIQHAQFQGQDPVGLWVEEAHKAGLKVHLWVEVFFAGNSEENPEPYGPILQKYPQWRNIQRRHLNIPTPVISDVEPGHYFVDPANPEVRAFLEKLLLEMVTRYEADGLNLDYIRYPASAPLSAPNYLNSTWGYTESARKAFQALIQNEQTEAVAQKIEALKKAGKPIPHQLKAFTPPAADPVTLTPSSPLWPRWTEWRKGLITSFVKNISEKAHAIRPNLLISAVVFPSANPVYSLKLQDYPYWAKEGYIQALTPIGLSPRPDLLRQQALGLKRQVPGQFPVYVGIFGMYNRATPVQLLEQIDAVHQAGMPGVMMFEWSRLRPEYEDALKEGPFRE